MKTRTLIILIFALFAPTIGAQNAQKADGFFQDHEFEKAYQQYAILHKKEPRNVLYTYRLARCEQELGKTEISIQHFREAGNKYALRNFYLGELCYSTYRFEEAKEGYEAYLSTLKTDHERYAYTQEQLRKTERALRYYKRVEDIAITGKTTILKTQLANHLATLFHDGGTLSEDHGLYTYTNQRRDRRYITIATPEGGSVICKQEKMLEDWSTLDTLPALINHSKKQNFPFLMSDGITLYYAAESENGLGGWDIYITRYNPSTNSYLAPEMLGMPFNSLDNDLLICMDETESMGVLVTERNQPANMVGIYTFLPNKEKRLLNEDDDYKRSYAQLQLLRQPQKTEEKPAPVEVETNTNEEPIFVESNQEKAEFSFILNDSVTYLFYDEFESEEAMAQMREYESIKKQLERKKEELQRLRTTYSDTNITSEREELTHNILELEKEVRMLKNEADRLSSLIRQTETQALVK